MANRDTLRAQAIEALRRDVPDALDWLPLGEVPAMRWSDGSAVEPAVPRGWLVMAWTRGDPTPDAELRRQAALFDRRDAAVLGRWLLELWIEHDTAVPQLTPARKAELRTIAERAAEMAKRFGRGGSDPEERYRQLLRQEENRPAPSAMPDRGLLAVVAACGDRSALPRIESYLEAWHDERPEPCRALRKVAAALAGS